MDNNTVWPPTAMAIFTDIYSQLLSYGPGPISLRSKVRLRGNHILDWQKVVREVLATQGAECELLS